MARCVMFETDSSRISLLLISMRWPLAQVILPISKSWVVQRMRWETNLLFCWRQTRILYSRRWRSR